MYNLPLGYIIHIFYKITCKFRYTVSFFVMDDNNVTDDYLNKKINIYYYGKLCVLILLIKKKFSIIWYIGYCLINSRRNQHKQISGGIGSRQN